MIYCRGHAKDYDEWQTKGAEGWSYADCLPYFKRSENHELGADAYRGGNGPLHVVRNTQKDQPLFQAFLDAGVEAGYPFTDDLNGYQQEGFGWHDLTIHNGQRWSTSAAYLHPVLHRANLTVMTETYVNKVLFSGEKAIGVEIEDSRTKVVSNISTTNEVVLSGGAINSPQLLMLSGIGDGDHLKQLQVPIVHHLPAVGNHMEDHIGVHMQIACKQPLTLYRASKRYPRNRVRLPTAKSVASYEHLSSQLREDIGHAMTGYIFLLRGSKNGTLRLRSANSRDYPRIDPKYLAQEENRISLRESIKLMREIFAQSAFEDLRGKGISPKDAVELDDEIDAWDLHITWRVLREWELTRIRLLTCRLVSTESKDFVLSTRPLCQIL
ncbi:hypothetical protein CCR75_003748 [Bremia lactucae]|uniref:Glucose-methanol-choline oxidoreductase N-terminal domain-containing protein n=1 Tax=Bremia lactucae TaxID=4779 RepID=A0A976FLJ3_BRELC|nr:hypothetical protein CCR75_003748 [Bremia lactucae]